MDIVHVHKNFISEAEQLEIIEWAEECQPGLDVRETHLVSPEDWGHRAAARIRDLQDVPYLVDELHVRIARTLQYHDARPIKWKLVMHNEGSSTTLHVDQGHVRYWTFYRGLLLIKKPEQGGEFVISEKVIDFPARSLLHYVGNDAHEVTRVVEGQRIILISKYTRDLK